jgi:hypothetical protein
MKGEEKTAKRESGIRTTTSLHNAKLAGIIDTV